MYVFWIYLKPVNPQYSSDLQQSPDEMQAQGPSKEGIFNARNDLIECCGFLVKIFGKTHLNKIYYRVHHNLFEAEQA